VRAAPRSPTWSPTWSATWPCSVPSPCPRSPPELRLTGPAGQRVTPVRVDLGAGTDAERAAETAAARDAAEAGDDEPPPSAPPPDPATAPTATPAPTVVDGDPLEPGVQPPGSCSRLYGLTPAEAEVELRALGYRPSWRYWDRAGNGYWEARSSPPIGVIAELPAAGSSGELVVVVTPADGAPPPEGNCG